MSQQRWWDAAVATVTIVVAVIVAVSWQPHPVVIAWSSLAAIAVLYALWGRRLIPRRFYDDPPGTLIQTILFQVILTAIATVGVASAPNILTMQAVLIPLIWVISLSVLQSVAATVGLVVALAVGFHLALSQEADDALVQVTSVQGLTLVFSVALGLWISRIARWGEERQQLLAELQAAQGELEAMHRDAGATVERERLAREIHDTIAQSLTSVVMLAERARLDETARMEALELIESSAREALTEARVLVAGNAALPAGASSLGETLERLAVRFARETGIRVETTVAADAIPRDIEVVLLRCAQEALSNVRKHAEARSASVRLEQHAGTAVLTVTDDGNGLGDYRLGDERGFGLTGMRDRLALVRGELSVTDRATGGGAVLRVSVPLPASDAEPGARTQPGAAGSEPSAGTHPRAGARTQPGAGASEPGAAGSEPGAAAHATGADRGGADATTFAPHDTTDTSTATPATPEQEQQQ